MVSYRMIIEQTDPKRGCDGNSCVLESMSAEFTNMENL